MIQYEMQDMQQSRTKQRLQEETLLAKQPAMSKVSLLWEYGHEAVVKICKMRKTY
jgi:hypothetical protein